MTTKKALLCALALLLTTMVPIGVSADDIQAESAYGSWGRVSAWIHEVFEAIEVLWAPVLSGEDLGDRPLVETQSEPEPDDAGEVGTELEPYG
ncbi:MAG: hypothetical protein AAGD06_24835 [Acidobacteriota bacterium]